MTRRAFCSVLALLVLTACSAPSAGAPQPVAQQVAASPRPTVAPSATVEPTVTAIQALIVTAEPTATTTPTPSATPSPTVIQAVIVAPPAQPPAPPAAQPAPPAAPQELRYATIPTDDGYVAVREQPTTASNELARLTPGTVVVCTEIVRGQTLFGSNRWAKCPSVGGYIFAPLLERTSAVPSIAVV